MKTVSKIVSLLILFALVGCSINSLFTGYRKEVYPVTQITDNNIKTVQFLNESSTEIQRVMNIAFYADSNRDGHFQVIEAKVDAEIVGQKDIYIPPLGVLNLTIAYAPLNLDTTKASFNGWTTTEDCRWESVSLDDFSKDKKEDDQNGSKAAVFAMSSLMKTSSSEKSNEYEPAIHRAMLVVAYDKPEGYSYVELVGGAVPGPDGEETAVAMGAASGDCEASGDRACFTGTFAIDLPGLMSGGALEVPMHGSIPFTTDGSSMELNMDEFPSILIPLVGNGPGEPLEGQPIDAVSIIISGTLGTKARGSFDGQNLSLSDVNFRARVLLGEITQEDINPGLATAVDFNIEDLEITTDQPFDGSKIVFGVETTLPATPSGNGLFDALLGNARVVVKFSGMLAMP